MQLAVCLDDLGKGKAHTTAMAWALRKSEVVILPKIGANAAVYFVLPQASFLSDLFFRQNLKIDRHLPSLKNGMLCNHGQTQYLW